MRCLHKVNPLSDFEVTAHSGLTSDQAAGIAVLLGLNGRRGFMDAEPCGAARQSQNGIPVGLAGAAVAVFSGSPLKEE